MRGVIVEDRCLRLRINHEAFVADVLQRVCFHTVSVIREIRRFCGHTDAGNLARNAASFFKAFGLTGLRLDSGCAKLFHVSKGQLLERGKGDAIAIMSVWSIFTFVPVAMAAARAASSTHSVTCSR